MDGHCQCQAKILNRFFNHCSLSFTSEPWYFSINSNHFTMHVLRAPRASSNLHRLNSTLSVYFLFAFGYWQKSVWGGAILVILPTKSWEPSGQTWFVQQAGSQHIFLCFYHIAQHYFNVKESLFCYFIERIQKWRQGIPTALIEPSFNLIIWSKRFPHIRI